MRRDTLRHGLVPILDSEEEFVHASQVLGLLVDEHVDDARVLHLHDGLHVFLDQFVLDNLDDPRLRALIQIMRCSLGLLIDSLFNLRQLRYDKLYVVRIQ